MLRCGSRNGDNRILGDVRVCAHCASPIVGRNRRARFCGQPCAQRARRAAAKAARDESRCLQCGIVVPYGRKYCSREHADAYRRGSLPRDQWQATDPRCPECGGSVKHRKTGARWCSTYCHDRGTHRVWYATPEGRRWQTEYSKRRYSEMRSELSAYRREYYRMHREETLATNKAWRDANPERRRLDSSRRRALIREASVFEVSQRDFDAIVRANGGLCVYCHAALVEHIDHVVPLARGGSHSVGNLVGACGPCNLSKGKKLLVEWKRDKLREGVVSTHAFSG